VLVVINSRSAVSKSVGEYYCVRRGIPRQNAVQISAPEAEEIDRAAFDRDIARPVLKALAGRARSGRIDALVLTKGVPLRIRGVQRGMRAEGASVDSELAALPLRRRPGNPAFSYEGPLRNPYFGSREPFDSDRFSIYLVTRLDGYTFADVKAAIDRSMAARDTGVAVLDAKSGNAASAGNLWLKSAAASLPKERVAADFSAAVLTGVRGVIAYASWGSNDPARKVRDPGFTYLPGAIATQYVSTDGRTFTEPPAGWQPATWENRAGYWAGSPQGLAADFLRQGATGASGHVDEPYLQFTPRPDILLPAYIVQRRTLAESFWASIPAVSWMNIVIGDPLCRLAP
jgi:uncharacterized protein (TIGR03790 family)